MGPGQILYAFEIAAKMTLQLVAVCAAAGVIVGVIALTGIGTRFSSMLLGLADQNQAIALFFAMIVSIILGMGMPTTAAYAVAASVIGPGLVQLGVPPPVALAAYAGAAIAQSDRFVVPFMFFSSPALLMDRSWFEVIHVVISALFGIYLLSSAVQGWFFGLLSMPLRGVLLAAALSMIAQGWFTDVIGLGVALGIWLLQKKLVDPNKVIRGAD
ncbi:TRAP transporter large permease subunit [Roseovarius sp.]|jgi:TRAP-type uncharacterized transport system fused permease subunit